MQALLMYFTISTMIAASRCVHMASTSGAQFADGSALLRLPQGAVYRAQVALDVCERVLCMG